MKLKIIFLVMVVYCSTLLANLPATVIAGWLPDNSVQLQGVTGTLWQGHANKLKVNSDVTLKDVDWQVDWSSLIGLSLAMQLSFNNGEDMSGKGVVAYGLSGAKASDLILDMSAETLLKLIPVSLPVDISGDFSATIQEVSQGTPYCEELQGVVVWNRANVYSPVGNVDLAAPKADLTCKEGNLVVKVNQKSAQLVSSMDIMLSEGGKYKLNGEILGTDKLAPSIAQSLTWIGPKNAKGATTISFNGVL